jgi:DNA polymerase-3 subunit alpha
MKYSEYFLIVWDLVNFAKKRGIPVGPGRGSAAGSLVAYVLGITSIDPLRYGLIFERFLNPGRLSMPDIDIDFCYERRDEVISYVEQKYGADHVAQIITFGTMLARAVVRDVGRVLGLTYSEVDRIAKLIEPNMTLREALHGVPELVEAVRGNSQTRKLIEISMRLEGLTRHASTHAAGVVISKSPLTELVPLYKEPKSGQITTQYAKDSIESIGLLKMDFLGLRTLTVIKNVVDEVKETRGIQLDIENIPLNDPKTFHLLSRGETAGVFQLESSGMRDLLRRVKPQGFEDLIALLALHRPGPLNSGMLDEFVKNKHGGGELRYLHPKLRPILEETYGVIVYQEQVMQIANTLGGFTLEEADELRKAMSKKIEDKMERMRERFIQGAISSGLKKEEATNIFELILKFAQYGFNKSHSAAYAMISYRTAYLKAHYPVEFMAALLTSELNNTDKIGYYVSECRRMGIEVLPPDINESFANFTVVNGGKAIRFGLAAIKNVGKHAIDSIISARKKYGRIKSLLNFCENVDLRLVNKRVIESLIKCGCFDFTGLRRSQLFQMIDRALEGAERVQRDRMKGQKSLFEEFECSRERDETPPEIPEWPRNRILKFEKDLVGLYITGHPLDEYRDELEWLVSCKSNDLPALKDGENVVIGGIVNGVKKITTRDRKTMAFMTLEDLTGKAEVILFPEIFKQFSRAIIPESIILVKGKVNLSGSKGEAKVNAAEVIQLEEELERVNKIAHLNINVENVEEEILIRLRDILVKFKGNSPLYLHLFTPGNKEIVLKASEDFQVNFDKSLVKEVEGVIGKGALWFSLKNKPEEGE